LNSFPYFTCQFLSGSFYPENELMDGNETTFRKPDGKTGAVNTEKRSTMKGITDIDENTIRRIDWQELFPAAILFRMFSSTFKVVPLIVSTLLLQVLSTLLLRPVVFFNGVASVSLRSVCPFDLNSFPAFASRYPFCSPDGILRTGVLLIVLYCWGLVISRMAAIGIASTARVSFLQSLKYAVSHMKSLTGVFLLPGIVLILLYTLSAFGLALLRVISAENFFSMIISFLTIPFIIITFVFAFFYLLALPLMNAAVATDKSDCFDAISRGFSYVTQRFLQFACYLVLAAVLLLAGKIIMTVLTNLTAVIYLTRSYHSVPTFSEIHHFNLALSFLSTDFWLGYLLLLPFGYVLNAFFVYTNSIYFILRRSVDGTPTDSIQSSESHKPVRNLKPLQHNLPEEPEKESGTEGNTPA